MYQRTGVRIPTYYGWKIAFSLAVTETVSWGILFYAISVFLIPMQQELGWSLTTLTGAYSLALLISGLCAPIVGRWIDRRGPRVLMTAGSVLGAICVLSWARTETVWTYYLAWVGIGVAMSATLYDPAFTTLTRWFSKRLRQAILVVTLAGGLASTIFLPLSGVLVEQYGWRQALVVLAILLAVLTIPLHGLVLRRHPVDVGQEVDGDTSPNDGGPAVSDQPEYGHSLHRAVRERSFWFLTIGFVLQTFATVAISIVLIPYLTDRGEDPAFAATVAGLVGAAQVLARIAATMIGDRMSVPVMTACICAAQVLGVAILIGWQHPLGMLIAVGLFGVCRGVVTLMRPQLVAMFYGTRNYGAINGTLAMFLTAAGALAPVSSGIAYSVAGGYAAVLWSMAVISLLATVAMLWVTREWHRRMPSA